MGEPTISILIATKNGEASVKRLLESLATDPFVTGGDAEIILLDDGSAPPISPLLVHRQLRNEQSMGVGAGRNKLAQSASGRYFLILDDDVELKDNTVVIRALELIQARKDRCMVAFAELDPEGNHYWLQPTTAKVRSRIGKFCGFAFLIPREMWNRCGGFAEILFYQYEELELSYRILQHGYDILYDPALAIRHHRKMDALQRARIHAWLLRNMMFTTILRFPLALVPLNILRSILQYRRFADDGFVVKMKKILWSLAELAKNFPELARQRQPLPVRVFVRFRALGRHPEPLDNA